MKIYLDDKRFPPIGWIGVSTAQQAINVLEEGNVKDISLDHDLGDEKITGTGYDVIVWIENKVATDDDYIPPNIYIHTSNGSARIKMELAHKSIKNLYTRRRK